VTTLTIYFPNLTSASEPPTIPTEAIPVVADFALVPYQFARVVTLPPVSAALSVTVPPNQRENKKNY